MALYYRIILQNYIVELYSAVILRPQQRRYLDKCTAPEALEWLQRITPAPPPRAQGPQRQPRGPPRVNPGDLPGHFVMHTYEVVHNL